MVFISVSRDIAARAATALRQMLDVASGVVLKVQPAITSLSVIP